jgi:AcrR family transcriptional regulator
MPAIGEIRQGVMGLSSSSMRRTPQQARGAQRIERILDAAAEVIGEVGYEATTTVLIAARAHTAIGSLYQFFPNKEAIVAGLLERYHDDLRVVYEMVLTPDLPHLPLPEMLDRIIDPLMEFELGRRGFMTLFVGMPTSPDLARPVKAMTDEVVGRIASIFTTRLPDLDPKLARRYSTVVIHMAKAFLGMAATPIMDRAEIIAEMKIALLRYLSPLVG